MTAPPGPRPDRRARAPSTPFTRTVLYEGREAEIAAGLAYECAREAITEWGSDLSVFKLDKDGRWCVAVLGDMSPERTLREEIDRHLAEGRTFELPARVTHELFTLRRRMFDQVREWERYYGR